MHFIVSNVFRSEQRGPWSDCADAYADLGIRGPHMSEDMFLHGTTQIYSKNVRWVPGVELKSSIYQNI